MAFPITLVWEVETSGSDTANGGNFDPNNANMTTDLVGTLCNTSAPSVTSASYSFNGSTDTNSWLYIKSGGTFQAGWYQISTCSAGAAILNAGVGYSVLSRPGQLCATVVAGGTSYAVGDTITLTGGGPAAVLIVLAVSSGVVTKVGVSNRGFYFSQPNNPVSQASSSGSGTGATFNVNWMASSQGRSPTFGELTSVGCASTANPNSGVWTVDYSQVGTAPWAVSGMTSSGAGLAVLTSAAVPSWVGNGIQITGGTNFNVGIYNISSVVTGTSMTLVGAGNSDSGVGASGTANVGGALKTLNGATSVAVASNYIWIGPGGYSQSANPTINPASETVRYTRISGYIANRGDYAAPLAGPTITLATGATAGIALLTNGWIVQNLRIDANSIASSSCITSTALYNHFRNLRLENFKVSGINLISSSQYSDISNSEITGGISGATAAVLTSSQTVMMLGNYIHDNACTGIYQSSAQPANHIVGNIINDNTGTTSDGISMAYGCLIQGNTVNGNGRDGIRIGVPVHVIKNNLITNNGVSATGYNLNYPVGDYGDDDQSWDGNVYYQGSASANRHNLGIGITDVILSSSPYNNAAAGDYSLNNVAGGGAAVRGAGFPGVMPGGLSIGYLDGGALQHQDTPPIIAVHKRNYVSPPAFIRRLKFLVFGGAGGSTVYVPIARTRNQRFPVWSPLPRRSFPAGAVQNIFVRDLHRTRVQQTWLPSRRITGNTAPLVQNLFTRRQVRINPPATVHAKRVRATVNAVSSAVYVPMVRTRLQIRPAWAPVVRHVGPVASVQNVFVKRRVGQTIYAGTLVKRRGFPFATTTAVNQVFTRRTPVY